VLSDGFPPKIWDEMKRNVEKADGFGKSGTITKNKWRDVITAYVDAAIQIKSMKN